MTLTRHWATSKIGGEQCLCPECGWSGPENECVTRIDGGATCPKCGHWVEFRDPPKNDTVRRPR